MNSRDILTLYDYNYWATRRILAASAHVSPEQFLVPTAHSFGSLRGTFVHILDAECAWRMLCQHQTLAYFGAMEREAFATFAVMERRWSEEERAMRDYLAHLTDADLTEYVRYTTPEGDKRERVLWHCLLRKPVRSSDCPRENDDSKVFGTNVSLQPTYGVVQMRWKSVVRRA
jgi:uncharacterized damage-inducible protein DinB